ncbi:MAG: glycosyltransferase [Ruthenibacterium lactatiformans]
MRKALTSIFTKTAYPNYEVLVVENNSVEPATFDYYRELQKQHPNCRVVTYEGGFNFSAINNFGRKAARGEYLLLLNNDVEVINGTWLGEMLALCAQPGVGIVGAKLYYPDDTIQHAGVIVGLGGYAGHSHKYAKRGGSGYMFRAATVQDLSAVTAACLLVKAAVYDEAGGLDEGFAVASTTWISACACGRWATGCCSRLTPSCTTMRARAGALTRKARPGNALRASAAA